MEVLPSPVGSILTNYFCKRRRRWRDPPIAFPGSAWLRWLSVGRQAGAKSPPIGILAGRGQAQARPGQGPPWEAGAYTWDAGARWGESKLTQSLPSPIHRNLTNHFPERRRWRESPPIGISGWAWPGQAGQQAFEALSCTKCQNPRQNRKRFFWNTCSRKSCFLADLGFGGAPNKNLARPAKIPIGGLLRQRLLPEK